MEEDVPHFSFLGDRDGVFLEVDAFNERVVAQEVDEGVDTNIRDVVEGEVEGADADVLFETLSEGDDRSIIQMVVGKDDLVADLVVADGLRERVDSTTNENRREREISDLARRVIELNVPDDPVPRQFIVDDCSCSSSSWTSWR